MNFDNEFREIREIITDDFVYRGELLNNKFDGNGEIYTDDYEYNGEFKEGYLHGEGVCRFKKYNCSYEGNFNRSSKHGYGKVISSDGVIIEGTYCNDKIGEALVLFPNKVVLQCNFINGKINGTGKTIYPNGDIIENQYKNGEIVKELRKEKITLNHYSIAESLLNMSVKN